MDDSVLLSARSAESIVRVIEAAPQVRRRFQFFVWLQNQLQVLVPHELALCAAYQRARREMVFEVFHSTVFTQPALELLTDARSALIESVTAQWLAGDGGSVVVKLAGLTGAALADAELLGAEGIGELLVHGVSRPQRPAEIESLFVFARRAEPVVLEQQFHLELLLPHLHATYLRVQATELDMNSVATLTAPQRARPPQAAPITERERQILGWVREGKSNQQIGELLGISPLTVKNHVQKILRKLGAANRAQAVAMAMTLNLLRPALDALKT